MPWKESRMVRILTQETPVEELQRTFTEELTEKMKEAAMRLGCPVEELKYRVGSNGVVEIARMTQAEMAERMRQDIIDGQVRKIRKDRGVFYG